MWLAPYSILTPAPLWLISSVEALFLIFAAYEIGFRVVKSKG
ncbi:hypothetical protein O9992_05050 [Vibrio lentus]|nr:hypothetical protein [Vibrio lentus]